MVGKQLIEYIINQTGNKINNLFVRKTDYNEQTGALKEELEAENERLKEDIAGLTTTKEETGENIYISDSAEMRFAKFNIDGNSKQNTTEGYNLYNNGTGTTTSKDVTIICDNGIMALNGTLSSSGAIYGNSNSTSDTAKKVSHLMPGTYKFIIRKVSGTLSQSTGSSAFYLRDSSSTVLLTINILNTTEIASGTITINEETDIYAHFYINTSGWIFNNLVLSFTLVSGDEIKDFEPYTNGASPNPDYPQEIHSVGENINLFDKDNANIIDGAYYSSDKVIGNTTNGKILYVSIESNTTYTVSKIQSTKFRVLTTDEIPVKGIMGIDYKSNNEGTSITITTSSNAQYLCIYYYNRADDTLTEQEILDSIKIEKNTMATGYSPFGQGCIDIDICNKNLADYTKWVKGGIGEDGVENTNSYTAKSTNYIPVLPNTTYTFSVSVAYGLRITEYNDNRTFIQRISLNSETTAFTFTTGNNTYYIRWQIYMGTTITSEKVKSSKLMIEQSTTATSYVPHVHQTYVIPTQQPMRKIGDYADTFIKENGIWYEKHVIIYIASYNDETIETTYMSTTGQLTTGAKVQYVATIPTDLPCTAEQIAILEQIQNEAKTYKGGTHIYSTDEISPIFKVIYHKDISTIADRLDNIEARLNLLEG